MRLLRDLRESTAFLILLAVTQERHTRLKTLADELGMTVQGVSDYVRRMTDAGLLQVVDGEHRATRKGVEVLQGRFLELKGFVAQAGRAIAVIEATPAFAGGPIRGGADPVRRHLYLGYLRHVRRGADRHAQSCRHRL